MGSRRRRDNAKQSANADFADYRRATKLSSAKIGVICVSGAVSVPNADFADYRGATNSVSRHPDSSAANSVWITGQIASQGKDQSSATGLRKG